MKMPQHGPVGSIKPPSVASVTTAFHYGRTPTLLLDSRGVVVDLNAACRELFALDVAGCRGRHYSAMVNRLAAKLDGHFPPPGGTAETYLQLGDRDDDETTVVPRTEDLAVKSSDCIYQSPRFGPIPLRVTELPRIDTELGTCVGSIIHLEPRSSWDSTAFQVGVDHRFSHDVMWEIYAASYDRVLSELPFYQEVLQRHCVAMQGTETKHVLDVGAGTGIATVQLLKLGKQVTAIDVNQAMLRRLYAKLDSHSSLRLSVIEDTAEYLPQLPDATFDGVTVLLAFFDMEDPWSALKESIRVLQPGGTLVITDPRSCFDVDQLMTFAEESLRKKGLLRLLADDWQRIQTVAPLIQDTIRDTQKLNTSLSSGGIWHAEAMYERLKHEGFSELTFRESHLGNCATIFGRKPL